MKLTIESNDELGYWMLFEDGIGLAKSKSRNVLVRIRDALNAVNDVGLVGLTVRHGDREDGERGVVLALTGGSAGFIVRLPDNELTAWLAVGCHIVEPEKPKIETPWNDPAIGIQPAIELLKRFLADFDFPDRRLSALADDVKTFFEARDAAQPT